MAKKKGGLAGRRGKVRQPPATTKAGLKRARKSYCDAGKSYRCSGDIEKASWESARHERGYIRYKERILKTAVFPAKNGCTFFVTRAVSTGEGVPGRAKRAPYMVHALCRGGRVLEGDYGHSTKAEALQKARHLAKTRKTPYRGI